MLQESTVIYLSLVGTLRTARMSSKICPNRIRLLIFVLSLLALLCRSSFVAARPFFCHPGMGKYFNTPETICGNTCLFSRTIELGLEMVHIFRTGPLR